MLGGTALLLLVVSWIASWLPARRAVGFGFYDTVVARKTEATAVTAARATNHKAGGADRAM